MWITLTAILAYGGLFWFETRPEADPANFLPRVRLPVLMLNGQSDSFFPPLSRETFYGLLGSPAAEKTSIEVPGAGHVAPRSDMMAEILAWLDRYLGPVRVR